MVAFHNSPSLKSSTLPCDQRIANCPTVAKVAGIEGDVVIEKLPNSLQQREALLKAEQVSSNANKFSIGPDEMAVILPPGLLQQAAKELSAQ